MRSRRRTTAWPGERYRDGQPTPGNRYRDGQPRPGERYRDGQPRPGERYRDGQPTPGNRYRDGQPTPGNRYRDGQPTPGERYRDGRPRPGNHSQPHQNNIAREDMQDLRIETRDELTAWLASHHGFTDLFVLRMEPRPQPSGAPLMPNVTLELASQIEGGFEAGDRRTLRVFRMIAEEVDTFWIENPRRYDSAFCSDVGMLQLDIDRPGLQFQVPARVQLVCRALVVHELADRTEIIQPWIDDAELSAYVHGYELPSPADLVQLFAQEGTSVVWRKYQEGPQTADTVPSDYSGWYLQEPERFAGKAGQGIFIFSAHARREAFVLHVQNHDPQNADLWRALQRILLHYPDLEIRAGNCRLNATQWRQYLKEGYVA